MLLAQFAVKLERLRECFNSAELRSQGESPFGSAAVESGSWGSPLPVSTTTKTSTRVHLLNTITLVKNFIKSARSSFVLLKRQQWSDGATVVKTQNTQKFPLVLYAQDKYLTLLDRSCWRTKMGNFWRFNSFNEIFYLFSFPTNLTNFRWFLVFVYVLLFHTILTNFFWSFSHFVYIFTLLWRVFEALLVFDHEFRTILTNIWQLFLQSPRWSRLRSNLIMRPNWVMSWRSKPEKLSKKSRKWTVVGGKELWMVAEVFSPTIL